LGGWGWLGVESACTGGLGWWWWGLEGGSACGCRRHWGWGTGDWRVRCWRCPRGELHSWGMGAGGRACLRGAPCCLCFAVCPSRPLLPAPNPQQTAPPNLRAMPAAKRFGRWARRLAVMNAPYWGVGGGEGGGHLLRLCEHVYWGLFAGLLDCSFASLWALVRACLGRFLCWFADPSGQGLRGPAPVPPKANALPPFPAHKAAQPSPRPAAPRPHRVPPH
jgi:hypothetical protein